MYIMRMYDKHNNATIGYFHSIQVAMESVKISWGAYPEISYILDINGITVNRKGFDSIEYGFEPIELITTAQHL